MSIAVLYARRDSVYKTIGGLDVYDIDRDARTWQGGTQLVAHPPCRAWGRLRKFAKPRDDEKQLALHAVSMLRQYGGVLEHPESSSLWTHAGLPLPGHRDQWGGFTWAISQRWFGHPCEKRTWLYIVGMEPRDLPQWPMSFTPPTHVIGRFSRTKNKGKQLKYASQKMREHTPPELAHWLVEVAARCSAPTYKEQE